MNCWRNIPSYGCELWMTNMKEKNKIQAAEMMFLNDQENICIEVSLETYLIIILMSYVME